MKHFIYGLSIFLFILFACNTQTEQTNQVVENEEMLARQYCSGCHQFAEPSALNKETWKKYVLPRMGYMLGFYTETETRSKLIGEGNAKERIVKANVFPELPALSLENWKKIQSYYLTNAPDTLTLKPTKKAIFSSKHFIAKLSPYRLSPPSTTMVQFANNNKQFYIGDANSQMLYLFNNDLKLLQAGKVKEGATTVYETASEYWITVMGLFSPTDEPLGQIVVLPKSSVTPPYIPIANLQRPVHSVYGDLDGDKLEDIVICEFGKWTGGLSLWKNNGNKTFTKQIIADQSGATKAYLHDFNKDGKLDIIGLFGQGREGIAIFYNEGNTKFTRKDVLNFPPYYGSSHFELLDYNEDGVMDILYTCGDNADYPAVLKPYHGIRIYENDGKDQFKETFFYQMYGAYKAILEDFDLDNDKDIAAISFFPNYKNQEETGFLFLENKGNNQFEPYSFEESTKGRWIVMDAGDIDADGDKDILLGSLTFEVTDNPQLVNEWINGGIPYILLENKAK